MSAPDITTIHAQLNISRESELLRSFVGVDDDASATPEPKEEEHVEEEKSNEELEKKKQSELEAIIQHVAEETTKKKRRRRRNGAKREELYCDKDRAAAVNLGSKDIKQSLRLKRKQDRSKALQIPEEAEPGTFLALGHYQMGRGDLKIAIAFFKKALELNPTEKSALVARSKCYILLGQPEDALKDSETALAIDKTYLKGIYQKAEALYYLGDFEHSLMYFHRGLHIRADHHHFKLGVYKTQKAIENAIGASNVFSKLFNSKSSSVRTDKSKSSTRSKLLRELAPDKEYLDNLVKNPNLKCKFKQDDAVIIQTIEETVKYLDAKQEFWRQQLPSHLK